MKRQSRSGGIISKNSGRTGLVVLTAAAMAWASQRAQAANLNWDPAPSTDSATGGGAGTWDLLSSNWFNGISDVQWTDVSTLGTDTAIFGGSTSGAVLVNTNLSAAELIFNTSGYALSGSNTLTLGGDATATPGIGINTSALTGGTTTLSTGISLAAAQSWQVGGGSTLIDSGSLSGAVGLTITGGGAVTLSANNTGYSGNTTVTGAILNINNNGALGSGTLTLNTGASIDSTTSGIDVNGNPVHWNGNFVFIGTNSLDLGTGTVTMGGGTPPITRSVIVKANDLTIDGQVTDAGVGDTLLKEGAGTLTLTNGTNSYTGNTSIGGGTLSLSSTGVLGSTTGTLTLGNGELNFTGARTITTGAVTDNAGLDTITVGTSGGVFSGASLGTRAAGAVEIYRGITGSSSVTFSSPPTPSLNSLTGPYGAYSSTGTGTGTQLPVLRGALVDSSATGEGIGFATYGASGVTLLTGQNSVTTTTGFAGTSTGDNVLISNPGATLSIAGKQINTLQINNTSGSLVTITPSGTLNASNGLLFTGTSPITLASGTTVDVTDSTNTEDSIILSTNTAGVTISSTICSAGGTADVGNVTFGGPGNFTINSSAGVVTKSNGAAFFDGPGTVTLAAPANMSSGGLQVLGGTLKLATGFSFPTARAWHLAAGATIDLNGVSILPTSSPASLLDFLTDVNGSGGTVTNSSATTATLTIENTSTTSGTQTFSGTITGNINLAQTIGNSTSTLVQILAGQSSYTGSTTINSATIRLGINNALPIGTALTVNGNSSTPASVFDLASFNQTVGSLAGSAALGTPTILNSVASTASTLTVASTANTAYAGVIEDNSGTGGTVALVKSGTGVLSLTGVNTFSGGTTINGGTLKANNATGSTGSGFVTVNNGGILAGIGSTGSGVAAGPVTINSGGKLDPGDNSLATLTVGTGGSLSLAGGAILDYDFTDAASDEVVVNGGLTLNATHTNPVDLNVFASGTTGKFSPTGSSGTETFNLIQYTGTALPAGTLTNLSVLNPVSATSPWSYTFDSAPGAGLGGSNLVQLVITFPPPESWAGGTSSNWNTATSVGNNWSAAQVPSSAGQAVTFPGTASRFTVDLDGSQTVGLISFTGGGANTSYVIDQGSSPSGGVLTLNNNGLSASITNKSGINQTISAPISLTTGFSTLISTNTTSDGITLSGGITGSTTSPIIVSGLGTVALTGSSTGFQGGVSINGGIVQINSATSLGASNSVATINAGTLEATTGGIVETRNFMLGSATSTIQIDGSGQSYEIDGSIADVSALSPGTLNLTTPGGSGTLILTGTTSNTGGINIPSTAVLQLGNTAGTLGATIGGGTLTNAGTINVGSASAGLGAATTVTLNSSLAGAGALNFNPTAGIGSGTLVLGGSNATFSGAVTVNNGTLVLGNAASTTATGIGNLTLNNTTLTTSLATAQIGFNAPTGATAALSPTMTFSGSTIINTGTGTLTIAEQFEGGTATSPVTINRNAGTGTLVLGAAGETALGVTAPFGNALFANFTNNVGSLVLAARGAGSSNTAYNFAAPTGTVTVNGGSGTINLGSLTGSQPIGATGVTRLGVGGLTTIANPPNNSTNNTTYSGNIGTVNPADIGVAKNGTGTFTLSGTNTYSGVALTNAGLAPTAVVNGTLIAGSSSAPDGSSGPFGASNGGSAAPGYVLIGNQGQGTSTSAVVLTSASLLADPGVTVANPVVVSGGGSTATTTAYTFTLGGTGAGTSTYSGGVILENDLTIAAQSASGQLNLTAGITGTDGSTGPDSTTVIQHSTNQGGSGDSGAGNSGFQLVTFGGPGSTTVSGATSATNPGGFGIFDSNDPNLTINSISLGFYTGLNGFISVNVTGGTTTFASANQYSGSTTVSGGKLVFGNLPTALAPRSVVALDVTGGVTQVATASTHAGRNVLVLSPGFSVASTTPPNSITPNPVAAPPLTISGTGTLDLTNNDMIVQGVGSAGLATINSELKTGFSGNPAGAWTGTGIVTSSGTIANAPRSNIGLADVLAGSTTSFDGVTVGANDVLVKYTYFGDANLDGKVNATDYIAIDNGFNSHASGWQNGDFNYDGVINGDDYALIDNAFNTQGGVVLNGISAGPAEMIASNTDQIAGASASAVPEPTTLGMLAIGGAGLLMRRRRRAR